MYGFICMFAGLKHPAWESGARRTKVKSNSTTEPTEAAIGTEHVVANDVCLLDFL